MDKTVVSFSFKTNNKFDLMKSYKESKIIFSEIGYEYNYFGAVTDIDSSCGIKTVKRSEKKLLRILSNNQDSLIGLSLYSLPKDFLQAAFDYEFVIDFSELDNILLFMITLNKYDYNDSCKSMIITCVNKFLLHYSLEIFEMDRKETPLLYAMGSNTPDFYESLKIIERIER